MVNSPEVHDAAQAYVRVIDFRGRDAHPGSRVVVRLTGNVRNGFAEAEFVRWNAADGTTISDVTDAHAPRPRRIASPLGHVVSHEGLSPAAGPGKAVTRPDRSQIRANLTRAGESLVSERYTRALIRAAIDGIMDHEDLVDACNQWKDAVGRFLSDVLLTVCQKATSKNPSQIAKEASTILRVDRNRKDILRRWG